MLTMKRLSILAAVLQVAGCGIAIATPADDRNYAVRVSCDVQAAGPVALPDLAFQQGATPLLSIDTYANGKSVTADTNGATVARFIMAPTATNATFVSVTNLPSAVTGNGYLVQLPTVGTNTASGAAITNGWWYSVRLERGGYLYWSGSGRLDIEATTSTADGLVWQTVASGVSAGTVTTIVTSALSSILPTSTVATATYAATAGSASNATAISGGALGTVTNIAQGVASAYLPLAGTGAGTMSGSIDFGGFDSEGMYSLHFSGDGPSGIYVMDLETDGIRIGLRNRILYGEWTATNITATGVFYGSGAGLTNITAAQVGAVSTNGGTVYGTLGGSNAVASSDFMTYEQGLSLLGGRSVWFMRGAFDTTVTWARMTSTDIPTTNWTVTIANATTGMYGPPWVITNLSETVIKEGVINISGIGSSYNTGGGRTASYKWEAYVTNTVTGGAMPEWSDQGSVKVLTGTADYLPMTIAIAIPTNLPTGSALIIRPKVTAATFTPTITIIGGSNSLSSISLPTGLEANLGTRGATGIQAFGGVATGTYDTVTRVLTMPALTFTNRTTMGDGLLNGTNGVYFSPAGSTNRYWILGGL